MAASTAGPSAALRRVRPAWMLLLGVAAIALVSSIRTGGALQSPSASPALGAVDVEKIPAGVGSGNAGAKSDGQASQAETHDAGDVAGPLGAAADTGAAAVGSDGLDQALGADIPPGPPAPQGLKAHFRDVKSSTNSKGVAQYSAGDDGFVSSWLKGGDHAPPGAFPLADQSITRRKVRFHVYDIPSQYVEGALKLLDERWPQSFCNRGKRKSNYTMLDHRHAHSLFTADVFMTRFLRRHPLHTSNPDEADAFVVPMMTHLYNCAGTMQYAVEIMNWVIKERSVYYTRMGHRDHFMFWWRWGMHHGQTLKVWKRISAHFPNVNFISFDYLELQGRGNFQDFSLSLKPNFHRARDWIVMPYPELSPQLLSADPERLITRERDVFFFFAGTSTIGGVRRWVKRACEAHPKDCMYAEFGASVIDTSRLGVPDYQTGMLRSTFCGHAAGDALSSRRPVSAVLAGCIPVLICDLCLYAFENLLEYESFAVFVHEEDVIEGRLFDILRRIPAERVKAMQRSLAKVRRHFVYPTDGSLQPGDALDMLAQQLVLRGSLYRQYRRWFATNPHLSDRARDYPAEPCNAKRYVRNGVTTPDELRDFNRVGKELASALLKSSRDC